MLKKLIYLKAAAVALLLVSCTRIERPELISPSGGETLVTSTPEFAWFGVTFARFYTIEISQDAGFTEAIDTMVFGDTVLLLTDTLELGKTYYWRVTAHNAQGAESEPSDVESFRVEEGIELVSPLGSDSTAWPVFSWKRYSTATSYDLNISRYADFRELYCDTTLADTFFVWPDSLIPFTYFWRVRGLASGEAITSWSVVRMLVSYRLSETYFPAAPGQKQTYTFSHLEGTIEHGVGIDTIIDTIVNKVADSIVWVKDTFSNWGRLYLVQSHTWHDVGSTFSITHDSIFSSVSFLGYLYPACDSSSPVFNSWDGFKLKVICGPQGMTLSWKSGTRGASGYDSIGILRTPGKGVVRQVRFTSGVPDTISGKYEWEIDSTELKQ